MVRDGGAGDQAAATVQVGHYEIVRRLDGAGAFEVVLARARDQHGPAATVLIRRLLRRFAADPSISKTFVARAREAASLVHPNIERVLEIIDDDDNTAVVVEYVAGVTLADIFDRAGQNYHGVPPRQSVAIARAVASALACAHGFTNADGTRAPRIHGGISPSNVVIGFDGAIVLMGFAMTPLDEHVASTGENTADEMFAYMSPEQRKGGVADERSDLFSAGAVLYELATGMQPFAASSPYESASLVESGAFPPPSQLNPDVPDSWERIILSALRADPADRAITADNIVEPLGTWPGSPTSEADSVDTGTWARSLFSHTFERDGRRTEVGDSIGSTGSRSQVLASARDRTLKETLAGSSRASSAVPPPRERAVRPTAPGSSRAAGRSVVAADPPSSADTVVNQTPAGSLLGETVAARYRVVSRLGEGGMGTVYVALQQPLERHVALKVISGDIDGDSRERFLREARSASRLNHPNIATVYDFGEAETGPYLAMELVDGNTLRRLIRDSHKSMDWERVVGLCTQIARGLAAAHHEGIVHRDIKPTNIIVADTPEGERVKILDFGLAHRVDHGASELTRDGLVIGTPAYMSPEQIAGVSSDVRSDLYAVGVMMFEMLAGAHPFVDKTSTALLVAHATEIPPALGTAAEGIPVELGALVDQLLAKRPSERPEDGAALVQRLEAIAQKESSGSAPSVYTGVDLAPEGHVTLVSTEIESSAMLWDRAPKSMRQAVDMHDAIIRGLLVSDGGYEVRAQGGAFLVAFSAESQAVLWALRAQREISQADWPRELGHGLEGSGPGLRVRMGVHVGNPECRRHSITGRMDYVGPMVKRCAGIQRAAHGGQILASPELAAALEGRESSLDLRVKSLGSFALDGFDDQQALVEIQELGGPTGAFPRPRSVAQVRPSNLAKDASAFVGRSEEKDDLVARFAAGARLITLVGPGGTGKTRLSRVASMEMLRREEGPAEAWFCDVSSATEPLAFVTAVANVLSVPLAGGAAVEDCDELVVRSLRRRGNVLLVIDNLEQVVAAAAVAVDAWLQKVPDLQVLATSREALGLLGEERIFLNPLDLKDGSRLFATRVGELGLADPGDAETVEELVKALDGIPLAIELAASRAGVMTPKQILTRLNRRFELLRGPRRGITERQMTLRGAIDWSWDLLSEVEREAFIQVSVFEGGMTIDAGEEILDLSKVDAGAFVLDVVQALKDKSLLRTETHGDSDLRLTMLQSIQEYAREKLERTEDCGDAVRERHAAYYLKEGKRRAKSSKSTRGREAINWLADNRRNLLVISERFCESDPGRAANALLILEPLLWERDPTDAHRQVLDRAIELARTSDDEVLLAEALLFRADLEQERGNAEQALEFVEDAQASLGTERVPKLRAIALVRQSRILYRLGRLQDCQKTLDEAEPLAKEQGAHGVLARILGQRGLMALGKIDQPVDFFSGALRLARRSGDRDLEARLLGNQAVDQLMRGNLSSAERLMEEALAIHRDNQARGLEGMTMGNLGILTRAQDRIEESESWLRRAIVIHREMGSELLEGADQSNLASTLVQQSRFADGIEQAKQALPLILANNGVREQLICRCILAAGHACLDQVHSAREALDGAKRAKDSFWSSQDSLYRLVASHIDLAEARLAGGGADDPRLDQARVTVGELASKEEELFLSYKTLEHAVAHYPSRPPDLSTDALAADRE